MFIIELTACRPGECSRKIYNKKKAQAGLEYIILLALLLAALVPIFIYSMDTSSVSIRTAQSREAVQRIAAAVDRLYAMGGGSMTVDVYLPSGIDYVQLGNNTVKIALRIGNGVGEAFAMTKGNLSGVIPLTNGYKSIPLRVLSNGTVYIGEGGENLTVLVIAISSPGNTTYENPSTVTASVSLSKDGYWCGVSLDGSANQTMAGSGTSWSFGLSGLSEATHSVRFHCNSSAGMKDAGPRYFTVNFIYYADLCELTADVPYPLDFTHGLNTTANTFGMRGGHDCWDWSGNVYGYSSCALFNNLTLAETGKINITIGNLGGCGTSGMGNGAYGIDINVTPEMYAMIQQGKPANLSFVWGFVNNNLASGNDAWVKARFGNGTVAAQDDFERAGLGGKLNGGFGWRADWYSNGGDADMVTGANYEGAYGLRARHNGYADRAVNLSGYSDPVISFYAKTSSDNFGSGENVRFMVSPDDANWAAVHEWNSGNDDGQWHNYTFRLKNYAALSSEFWIAFDSSAGNDNKYLYADDIWVTDGDVSWLGSNLDAGTSHADATNELYWSSSPATTNSNFAWYNLNPYIKKAGIYYLDFGGKVYSWSSGRWGGFYFDNITLVID